MVRIMAMGQVGDWEGTMLPWPSHVIAGDHLLVFIGYLSSLQGIQYKVGLGVTIAKGQAGTDLHKETGHEATDDTPCPASVSSGAFKTTRVRGDSANCSPLQAAGGTQGKCWPVFGVQQLTDPYCLVFLTWVPDTGGH